MDNTKKILVLSIAIIVILGTVFLGSVITGKVTRNEAVKIGAALPLTGVSNYYGQTNREGIELALEEVNNAGGINGKLLKIIYEDSQSQQKTAVTILEKLIEVDAVPVVLVGAISPETLAQAPIAEEKKTVILALGSAAEKIRYAGDYVFRLKISVNQEVEALMKFVHKDLKAKRIYILYAENDYGDSIRQSTEKIFAELGGEILGKEGFVIEETDFRTYLIKAKEARPDVIVLGAWPRNLGQIMKQAKELGINTTFVAPGGAIGPEIIEIAGTAADGLIYTMEFDLESDRQAVKEFKTKFKSKYNKEPELFSGMGYDSIYILADILKICKNSECIKEGLYNTAEYEGASGIITFDEFGDVSKPLTLMQIKNGEFVKYNGQNGTRGI